MIEIKIKNVTYQVSQWVYDLLRDHDDFDAQIILEKMIEGKYLIPLEQAVMQ